MHDQTVRDFEPVEFVENDHQANVSDIANVVGLSQPMLEDSSQVPTELRPLFIYIIS